MNFMVPGAPIASGWFRSEPRRSLPAGTLERIIARAFPQCRVLEVQPLAGGQRNANFRLRLDAMRDFLVLRIYEHDPSLCAKEMDLLDLVGDSVPCPPIVHAETGGWNGIPPFAFMGYVEGITLHEHKHNADLDTIAQAARSAGETLAAIGRTTFPESGWLGPGAAVTAPLLDGADPGPRFIDLCLAAENTQRRLGNELRERIHNLAWSYAPQFAAMDEETSLVHGDFGKRNLLVHLVEGTWRVAAVLDWEFAISGSPLTDLGHFLRYECSSRPVLEPHFSQGYLHAGGKLPEGWRRLARIVDLIALCDILTRDGLPSDVVAEIVELVSATVENRDPQFG